MADKFPSKGFLVETGKMRNLTSIAVSKKLLKGQYQLYFEFINRVLFPRPKKRTVATMTDLYLIEKLSILVKINFSAIMIEYMTKVYNMAEGKYGIAYGYLLNWKFEHYRIELSRGVMTTMK